MQEPEVIEHIGNFSRGSGLFAFEVCKRLGANLGNPLSNRLPNVPLMVDSIG
jgi:hypothetical protein